MRERKYSAWDKVAKQFVDDFVLDYLGNVYQCDKCEFWGDDRDLELTEYTGLKDKNNREIWEGDILKIIARSAKSPRMKWEKREYIGEIRYSPPAFDIYLGDKILLVDGLYRKNLEVIGNKFENPELLK